MARNLPVLYAHHIHSFKPPLGTFGRVLLNTATIDFGPSECSDNTAIQLPQINAVIISDLVYNRVDPWLAEGRSDLWLAALAKAKRQFDSADVLYPGHGAAGSASIIDEQAAYINAVRDLVANALKQDPRLSDASRCHSPDTSCCPQGSASRNDHRHEYSQFSGRGQIAKLEASSGCHLDDAVPLRTAQARG
jgi:hypothetical protein